MTLTKGKYQITKDGLIGIEVTQFGDCQYQVIAEYRDAGGILHRSRSNVGSSNPEDVLGIVWGKINACRYYAKQPI